MATRLSQFPLLRKSFTLQLRVLHVSCIRVQYTRMYVCTFDFYASVRCERAWIKAGRSKGRYNGNKAIVYEQFYWRLFNYVMWHIYRAVYAIRHVVSCDDRSSRRVDS